MKTIIGKLLNKFGYQIQKIPVINDSLDQYSNIDITDVNTLDLEDLSKISRSIPGMISPRSGQFLYTMCYMQQLLGDVVEIGSWQGRSTSFLARAVGNSGNGKFYAIDHFKGNVGKEHYFVVEQQDLSDLKENFLSNMERIGLKTR